MDKEVVVTASQQIHFLFPLYNESEVAYTTELRFSLYILPFCFYTSFANNKHTVITKYQLVCFKVIPRT